MSYYLPRSILAPIVGRTVQAIFEAEAYDDTEHGPIRCIKYVSVQYKDDDGTWIKLPGEFHHVWVEDPDELLLSAGKGDVMGANFEVTVYVHRKTGETDWSVQHPTNTRILRKANAFH